VLNCIKVCQWD